MLYAAVVFIVLFVLLLLPGLVSPGAMVTVQSVPPGASVLVDGQRIGNTPIEAFVPSGARTVTLQRPSFAAEEVSVRVPNRLIAGRFFPARVAIHRRLVPVDPAAIRDRAAREFSAWATIGSASAQYQFPWVLSDAVADLAAAPDGLRLHAPLLLDSARADVRSDALLRDYLRASALATSQGYVASPSHLKQLFSDMVILADAAPNLPILAAAATAGAGVDGPRVSLADEVRTSPWYRLAAEEQTTRVLPFTTEAGPDVSSRGRITVAGASFVHLSGGSFVMGMDGSGSELDRPHVVSVSDLYLQSTPVTRAQFRAFLTDVPAWRESERDTLVNAGLVTADYLRSWGFSSDPGDGRLPATEISWHAAQAYLEWLTRRLPPAFDGYRARLPFEEEYEWAVEANGSAGLEAGFRRGGQNGPYPVNSFPGGEFGITDLMGNVWQWMQNSFRPADYLVRSHPHSPYGRERVPASERSVRGGSWANSAQAVRATTRGSQPPDWATPFLGFRPVLSRVE